MDGITAFVKNNYIWVIIFGVLIIGRFILIDTIPPGMQVDEVEYALSSKTFQMMGKDLSGVPFPQTLITSNTIGRISPIPYIALSPFWFFLNLNLTTFRVLYALLNVITMFAFAAFLHIIFKNKHMTFLGALIFFLNPWSFFLSRHAIDGAFALLFYLLGSLFLLKKYSRTNLILSTFFFLLGCFSYHGAKLQLIPLVLILSTYKVVHDKKHGKAILPYVWILTILSTAIVSFFLGGIILKESVIESRGHEFIFTNLDTFSQSVNELRETSLANPLQHLMINKVLFAFQYILDNYFQAFDVTKLFLHAEILNLHGFFYFFEVVFLIIGGTALLKKDKSIFWLATGITLIAPISTIASLSGFSILNRGVLLLPSLLIFITYGLYVVFEKAQQYLPQKAVIVAIGLCYLGSFFYFQYTYFFILPLKNIMHYETNSRVLARYLSYEKSIARHIIIASSQPHVYFRQLVFYLPRDEQEKILRQHTFTTETTEKISFGNITIQNTCPAKLNQNDTYILDSSIEVCPATEKAQNLILDQRDAGTDFFIVNSKSCQEYNLTRWLNPHYISDFHIDTMSKEQFCKRWIAETDIIKTK